MIAPLFTWWTRWRHGRTIRITYTCAWCHRTLPTSPLIRAREMSDPPTAELVSNGICPACVEQLRATL